MIASSLTAAARAAATPMTVNLAHPRMNTTNSTKQRRQDARVLSSAARQSTSSSPPSRPAIVTTIKLSISILSVHIQTPILSSFLFLTSTTLFIYGHSRCQLIHHYTHWIDADTCSLLIIAAGEVLFFMEARRDISANCRGGSGRPLRRSRTSQYGLRRCRTSDVKRMHARTHAHSCACPPPL